MRKILDYNWIFISLFSLVAGTITFFVSGNIFYSLVALFALMLVQVLVIYFSEQLRASARIKKIERVFPDFLQLMSSNLRAGMTVSKAMLLSARDEFAPLNREIMRVGNDITTGKNLEGALTEMGLRIGSEKVSKTILLIISGIKAGGNIAVLLEETAVNIRERDFVEKRASSNVTMYFIFIFIAVAIIAPLLFALSNILVEVMTNLLKGLPSQADAGIKLPFTMSSVGISVNFVRYFSLCFILMIDVLSSMVLGLVSKGEEREGLRYLIPILILSFGTFFLVKLILANFLTGLF